MNEQEQANAWNHFIEDLERSARDRRYQRHPDRFWLTRYLDSSIAETDDTALLSESLDNLDAWLEGDFGWSTSTVSLHVLTCSICRKRIRLMREEQFSVVAIDTETPWWKRTVDALNGVLASPRVRWAATAGVIGIVFLSLTLSLLPDNPSPGPEGPQLPVDRHEPEMGGIS